MTTADLIASSSPPATAAPALREHVRAIAARGPARGRLRSSGWRGSRRAASHSSPSPRRPS